MRCTYDETMIILGSPLLPTRHVGKLMRRCMTRGSSWTLGKYALNTPVIKLELSRMISDF